MLKVAELSIWMRSRLTDMNLLKAGFGRVDFTPPLGIHINGYFIDRYAEKILDPLEINCLALACEDTKVALISVDNMGIYRDILDEVRRTISDATGIAFEAVYIHCTHSHTCAYARTKAVNRFINLLYYLFCRCVPLYLRVCRIFKLLRNENVLIFVFHFKR